MSRSSERRQQILEYLSVNRTATYIGLAEQFGVSKCTIRKDIDELTLSAPIYTRAGKGGGIRVADGWYLSRTYLREDQVKALEAVLNGLQPDMDAIQSILATFAKPQVKETNQ